MRPLPGRPGSPQYRQGGIATILKAREREKEWHRRRSLRSKGICPDCYGSGTKWFIFDCSACGGTGRSGRF